jgi:hypothetical protein
MSHATSTKRPRSAPLYERDLHAWSREQARLLREGRLKEVDAENVAEEILDVGSNEYDKLESALRVLLLHMLMGSPARETYPLVGKLHRNTARPRITTASQKSESQEPDRGSGNRGLQRRPPTRFL